MAAPRKIRPVQHVTGRKVWIEKYVEFTCPACQRSCVGVIMAGLTSAPTLCAGCGQPVEVHEPRPSQLRFIEAVESDDDGTARVAAGQRAV